MSTFSSTSNSSLVSQCATVAITAITKTFWGFWLFIAVVFLVLIYLISADDPTESQVAAYTFLYSTFGLLSFCAVGSNMVEMSTKMRQPLNPDYPANFWYSALAMLALYGLCTSLLFAQFGLSAMVHANIVSIFAATTGLFVTNGMAWLRSILLFGAVVLLGYLIDAFFENVRNEMFGLLYENLVPWVNSLLTIAAIFFFLRWRAALSNKEPSPLLIAFQNHASIFLSYIDIRNPQYSKNV